MTTTSTGRVAQGEVISDFADGGSYIKSKLESSVLDLEKRKIQREQERSAASALDALELSKQQPLNSADVDYVVAQLGCTKTEAETALRANRGDLVKTLVQLVKPRQRAKSVDAGGEAPTKAF